MNKNKIRYNYGRRRSRSLGGLLNARDICKTIEKSVLPSQRLQLLLEYAIEHGLSKAEKNLDEDIDYDEFRKSISICQVKIESDIEEMNYCSLAVSKDENGELNLNNSLNEKYNSYSSAVAKLEEENKQWDNLLTKYRTNLEKEINLEEMHFKGPFNCEKYQHLDYSNLYNNLEQIDDHLKFQLDKMKRSTKSFTTYVNATNRGTSSLVRKARENFKKSFDKSPRTLIKNCF